MNEPFYNALPDNARCHSSLFGLLHMKVMRNDMKLSYLFVLLRGRDL